MRSLCAISEHEGFCFFCCSHPQSHLLPPRENIISVEEWKSNVSLSNALARCPTAWPCKEASSWLQSAEKRSTHIARLGNLGLRTCCFFLFLTHMHYNPGDKASQLLFKQFSSAVFHYPDTTEMSWNGLKELQEFAWKLRQQFCLASAGLAFWQVHILNAKQHAQICLDKHIRVHYSFQQEGTLHHYSSLPSILTRSYWIFIYSHSIK